MKNKLKPLVIKTLKISGITLGVLLLFMFIAPMIFPNTIAEKIKHFANEKLNGELNFKEANLSFFHNFPSLTLTLKDFSLKGSAPFKKDTLVAAKEIAFGINIRSLIFDKKVNIDQIFVSNALMNVKVNENGDANYNVYVSDSKSTDTTTSSTALKLSKIQINQNRPFQKGEKYVSIGVFCQKRRFVLKKHGPGDFITVTGSEKIFGYPSDQSMLSFSNKPINKTPVVNLIGQLQSSTNKSAPICFRI